AARHGITVRRGEPHRLPARDHAVFAAVRAADTDIRPVVTGILSIEAVDVHDPLSIRRPVGSEVEMLRFAGKADAVRSVNVAGPDLITLRAGQMKSHSSSVGAEAQTVRQSVTSASELACVAPVKTDVVNLPDLLANDLHEDSIVAHHQSWRHKGGQTIFDTNLIQCAAFEVVHPKVGRSLRVILVERPAWAIAS